MISTIPLITLITTGVGLFEANALPFGLDQLLEAPTPKLIGFIHWYYWTHNVVQLVAVYLTVSRKTAQEAILRAGLNPFKNIYRVLKYSWNHKVPEHRSAFTYWEEDIPRRIDLGKNKYGGPFTNEEVEDTKTFLRILPLILCLFGYHLAGSTAHEHSCCSGWYSTVSTDHQQM